MEGRGGTVIKIYQMKTHFTRRAVEYIEHTATLIKNFIQRQRE